MFSVPITAQAAVPGAAEGDSYAAYGQVFVQPVLGKPPVTVGPLSAARATIPPGSDPQSASNSLVNFSGPGPLVHHIAAASSNAKATLGSTPKTDCWSPDDTVPVVTPPFNPGPLTGGNACSHVADAGIIPQGTAPAPVVDLVSAQAVDVQSITQSCTATPVGAFNLVNLTIQGNPIQLGPVPPNTVIPLAIGTLILNEQIYDNHGHGLTVNGIHVFLTSQLSPLLGADVIVAHAHSEALCSDSSTTDTGTLPCIGANPCVRPVITKADSTKSANPGETVTYTVDIDPKTCPITSVTDILPLYFHYVSSSGNLGTPQLPIPSLTNGQQVLFWSNGGAPLAAAPHEVITVTLDPNTPPNLYINNVFGTSDCGSFAGIDFGILTTGPIANQGNHPGIIVPRPAPPAAPAAPPASGTEAAALTTPFTGTGAPDAAIWLGASLLALLSLAGVGVIQARRVIRATRVD
jgi:hypothetical protein